MTATIRLCRVDDLVEGEPQQIDPQGTNLSLAVYTAGDGYYVTDALCTHGMALLSDGYQEDFVIECPLHGGSFDIRSGAPLTAPCEMALKTYPVVLEDGWVAISHPAGEA
jgi:ethylbenzene dioxygenase ferredoxin subunit